MFTGIIEETGKIQSVKRAQNSIVLTVLAEDIMPDVRLGDSIAVNGVCLTVSSLCANGFSADVMHETLDRSELGSLHSGCLVNLERAMPANGRFGGHIVSGHIDGTGTISDIHKDDNAVWYTFKTTPSILRYIIEKGSVAVDGISLTVAKVYSDSFCISVIPHTASKTTLSDRRVGDSVNIENDCIGKYVEHLMGNDRGNELQNKTITAGFLMKHGY